MQTHCLDLVTSNQRAYLIHCLLSSEQEIVEKAVLDLLQVNEDEPENIILQDQAVHLILAVKNLVHRFISYEYYDQILSSLLTAKKNKQNSTLRLAAHTALSLAIEGYTYHSQQLSMRFMGIPADIDQGLAMRSVLKHHNMVLLEKYIINEDLNDWNWGSNVSLNDFIVDRQNLLV